MAYDRNIIKSLADVIITKEYGVAFGNLRRLT